MFMGRCVVFCKDTSATESYTYGHTLSLHDALPIPEGWITRRSAPSSAAAAWTACRTSVKSGWSSNGVRDVVRRAIATDRSEEHTSELQSLMRISYAVFCLNKKKYRSTRQYTRYNNPTITRTHTTYNHQIVYT